MKPSVLPCGKLRVEEKVGVPVQRFALAESVQWAESICLTGTPVVLECQLWQQALERARGEDFGLDQLKKLTSRRGYIQQP